jgi:ATP-binding cassette subfamily B protein
LSHRIGIVTQDPQLFSGSIKDNLIFVKPSASDEDCMRVIEQAQLVEFINSQPEGLNTKIGEG